MRKRCKCCGQLLPFKSAMEACDPRLLFVRVYELVRRAGDQGILTGEVLDTIYADDPEGGPLTARNCLRVHKHRANKYLKTAGQKIICTNYGGNRNGPGKEGYYRLVEIK